MAAAKDIVSCMKRNVQKLVSTTKQSIYIFSKEVFHLMWKDTGFPFCRRSLIDDAYTTWKFENFVDVTIHGVTRFDDAVYAGFEHFSYPAAQVHLAIRRSHDQRFKLKRFEILLPMSIRVAGVILAKRV
jgi:hypothetical protein